MEDLYEDSLYFFYKANLTEKVDFQHKLNSGHGINNTEKRWEPPSFYKWNEKLHIFVL